ncbi:MAG TPA: amylo-alpha-1,6-glucosidase, partial [Nitrospirota bacterium]
ERIATLEFDRKPDQINGSAVVFNVSLNPQETYEVCVTLHCLIKDGRGNGRERGNGKGDGGTGTIGIDRAYAMVDLDRAGSVPGCRIISPSRRFNNLIDRSHADLHMLETKTKYGPYPYAGIPWFSTVFGRDGIITSMEALWINPEIAKGVLHYLASTQSDEDDPDNDAEPGKILHESRLGEMAMSGEIPFKRYYGSIDSTPLFVMLAGMYYQRTADKEMAKTLWPNVERALEWMDNYGDIDGDGFIEYRRRSPNGLVNQGWKDSYDSVSHSDGSDAEPPIALCEVQGYAYAAKRYASELAFVLGKADKAEGLRRGARELKERFNDTFWCDEIGTYAMALDGKKRLCRIKTSNAGHCLFTKVASDSHARQICRGLMARDMFSGWGIRTLGSEEVLYNPMSYHNGSIWPHDNALIAQGLAEYGFKDETCSVLTGMYDTSMHVDLNRLPELFCGFHKREGQGPTLYPVACSPQAWASAAIFMLLQACLGLGINAPRRQVRFDKPTLPDMLASLTIENLKVGDASVDLSLLRQEEDVGVHILRRHGELEVLVVK